MRSSDAVFETSGYGLWSKTAKEVQIKGLDVPQVRSDEAGRYGQLHIYFNTASWDVEKDGLIYTDPVFLEDVKDYLTRAGYDATGLTYSEYGMQDHNFVSFDADEAFIASWSK